MIYPQSYSYRKHYCLNIEFENIANVFNIEKIANFMISNIGTSKEFGFKFSIIDTDSPRIVAFFF